LSHVPICSAYRCGGDVIQDFPADLKQLAACKPVLDAMPGWQKPTRGVRRYRELPEEARDYIDRLEEISGVPISIISTGSDRDDTIVREDSVVERWTSAT
ncbi:MAG: adenylosuccinate synthetase, partial [Acidobacteria bacterium]|nr:adenylosuccinate synthetase [Acidobacteriota bacterium]